MMQVQSFEPDPARAGGRAARARGKPKVMQVVLSLTPGGTERLVVEICRRLRPEFDVAVCCLDDEGAWSADLRAVDIEVTAIKRKAGFRPGVGGTIARLAAEQQVDLLHCHQYSPFVYGRIAAMWNRRLRLVYTEHGRFSDAPPGWKRCLVNPLLAKFDGAIVAVSHELRDYMIDSRFARDKVGVIHNGIDPGPLPTEGDRRRARRNLGLASDAFVVASVARLDPVKDLLTLLEAFAEVRRRAPWAQLLIVGDGPERARLEERVRRHDLAAAVRITGFRPDVRALLPAADAYVSSSISEGISITILEAMAAGVPVIATAVGGTPEILADGSGVLVPSRSPAQIAEAVLALAHDERRRTSLAAAGRLRLETSFTIDRMVEDYARAYRRLIG